MDASLLPAGSMQQETTNEHEYTRIPIGKGTRLPQAGRTERSDRFVWDDSAYRIGAEMTSLGRPH